MGKRNRPVRSAVDNENRTGDLADPGKIRKFIVREPEPGQDGFESAGISAVQNQAATGLVDRQPSGRSAAKRSSINQDGFRGNMEIVDQMVPGGFDVDVNALFPGFPWLRP